MLAFVMALLLASSVAFAQPAAAGPLEDFGAAVMSFFGLDGGEPSAQSEGDGHIVDGDTFDSWENYLRDSEGNYTTENIGRIWTDKSVFDSNKTLQGALAGQTIAKGDSDFLVALSALSSTSNLTTSSQTPLDIVLVLDTSGSMGNNQIYSYTEVYSDALNTFRSYYINVGGSWQSVSYSRGNGWRYQQNSGGSYTYVTPKTSAGDTENTQFYSRSSQTRLAALQSAANTFIDQTAEQNENMDSGAALHRISIVSFSDNGTVRQNLTEVTSSSATTLKQRVNALSSSGNTYPGNAMTAAANALANARDDSQKVVIFFTDGNPAPAGTDDFNESMANNGVSQAKSLKDNGTLIYSIGVFDEADPSNTSTGSDNQFNAYMHAMSSNYPNATAWNVLGSRVANSDYYKAATTSDELNKIFSDIQSEFSDGVGVPTDTTTTGGFDNDGYITFTDQLGDFMQVDDFKSIIYNNTIYTIKKTDEQSSEGKTVYTYICASDDDVPVNGGTTTGTTKLTNIVITVTHSSSSQTGDTVEVKIPASLIPLREFDIETDENDQTTMTVNEAYPIRIFYGVSVKDGILEPAAGETLAAIDTAIVDAASEKPTTELGQYIKSNKENGTISFYSNAYTATKGEGNGDTTANFTPSQRNGFYYFAEETPVYTDPGCTIPATGDEANAGSGTFYYKKTYYTASAGADGSVPKGAKATLREHIHEFPGSNFKLGQGNWKVDDNGNVVINPKAHRVSFVGEMKTAKAENENKTNTAANVINPVFENNNEGGPVNVYLGNNGMLTADLPGALTVSKAVSVDDGADESTVEGKTFAFTLALTAPADTELPSSLQVSVQDASGNAVDDAATSLSVGADGQVSFELKDGQNITIFGLDAGTRYEVTEDTVDGFTAASTGDASGTIAAGVVASAAFTNTYSVDPVTLSGANNLKVQKVLDGRAWDADDSFDFVLAAVSYTAPGATSPSGNVADVPLPAGGSNGAAHLEVTNGDVTSFGDIEFTKAGTYVYTISELTPDTADRLPGVTYSNALWRVTVTVTDDGKGALTAESTMAQTFTDGGAEVESPTERAGEIAVIINTFSTDDQAAQILATKLYTDNSGENPITGNKFTFKLKALSADAPMPEGLTADAEGYVTIGNALDRSVAFLNINFNSADHDGHSYVYELSEVTSSAATKDNGYTVAGMTYDPTVYFVKVDVNVVNGVLDVTTRYYDENPNDSPDADPIEKDGVAVDRVPFINVYTPEPVTLSEDTDTAIRGTKTLTGRASQANEFSFELKQASGPDGGATIAAGGDTATAPAAKAGEPASFSFGDVIFTKPGTYTFTVTEKVPAADAAGLTYDRHTCTVTVEVTDTDGVLSADVTYDNGTGATDNSQAAFTNVYQARGSFNGGAGLNFTKTLTGRGMQAGEFTFTVTAPDGTKTEITNGSANSGVANTMTALGNLTFDQDDAGKTFTYTIDEVEPDADDDADTAGIQSKGVTYDQSVYEVAIQVKDNGDGTLDVTSTIKKSRNADGTDATDAESLQAIAFANTYEADPAVVETGADTDVELSKTLSGRTWQDGEEYTFSIENTSAPAGVTAPMPDEDTVSVGKPASGGTATFGFGNLTFDRVGTYVYKVQEIIPDDAVNKDGVTYADADAATREAGGFAKDGVTYTSASATITVSVTDNGEGQLEASASVAGGAFVNEYGASANFDDAVDFTVTKTMNGRDMARGEFEFEVSANATNEGEDNAVSAEEAAKKIGIGSGTSGTAPSAAGKDGEKVEMAGGEGELSFTAADSGKTFSYTFTEVQPTGDGVTQDELGRNVLDGVTYDGTSYTLDVTPTDNGDGTMSIETVVTKTTASGESATDTYTWTTGDAKQAISFDFVNTYGSTMAEGQPVNLDGLFTKTFTGRTWTADDAFTFKIEPAEGSEGAPLPKETELTLTGDGKSASQGIDFGAIEYTFDDIKDAEPDENGVRTRTFTYDVSEVVPAAEDCLPGVTYDTHTAQVTVTLTDDGFGNLTGTVGTVVAADATFENTYSADLDYGTAGALTLTKTLAGRDMTAGQFELTVKAADEASAELLGLGESGSKTYTVPAAQAGEAAVVATLGSGVTFTQDDAGKTYSYTVSETKTGDAGYANDDVVRTVTIEVHDNADATLTATTTVTADGGKAETYTYTTGQADADPAVVAFTNSYSADPVTLGGTGDVAIKATKTLTGRDMAADEFAFAVTNAKDAKGTVVATGTNAAAGAGKAGTVSFTGIEYTSEGLLADAASGLATASAPDADGKVTYTYQYNVAETGELAAGIAGVATSFDVIVNVTDNNDGTLSLDVVYPEGSDGTLSFTNAYGATATAKLSVSGEKVYVTPEGTGYNAPDIAGAYSFKLTGSEGAPMPEKTTAVNDAAGNVDFGAIEYTMENVFGTAADAADDAAATAEGGARSRTFTYTVSETGSVDGVTNDAASKTFKVTVTDDGDGHLSAVADPATGALFSFTNAYRVGAVDSSVSDGLTIEKTLTGRDMAAGEFSFELVDAAGNVVATGTNAGAAAGEAAKVSFDAIEFTTPGTYAYTVREAAGKDGNGVSYDTALVGVTATVTDNGDGTLSVAWSRTDGKDAAISFENTYRAASTSIGVNAAKVLDGRDLEAGEFTFELREDGRVIGTAENAADGSVHFETIVYDEPGEHDYEIAEVKGSAEGVTYDETVHTLHVSVTDDGTGRLALTWSYGETGAPVFVNAYEAPEEPAEPEEPVDPGTGEPTDEKPGTGDLPGTGDTALMTAGVALAAAVVAIGAGAVLIRRRNR